jgi:hypothetical protein
MPSAGAGIPVGVIGCGIGGLGARVTHAPWR